jgi:hypothetical protein
MRWFAVTWVDHMAIKPSSTAALFHWLVFPTTSTISGSPPLLMVAPLSHPTSFNTFHLMYETSYTSSQKMMLPSTSVSLSTPDTIAFISYNTTYNNTP